MADDGDRGILLDLEFAELISLTDLTVTRTHLAMLGDLVQATTLEDDEVAVLKKMPAAYRTKVLGELLAVADVAREFLTDLDAQLLLLAPAR